MEDESPHPQSLLEWWYVHGHYEASPGELNYFMASLFRHNVAPQEPSPANAFSFLASIYDPTSARRQTSSRIDRTLLDAILRNRGGAKGLNLDQRMTEVFLNEVQANGPPRNIELLDSEVELKSSPFGATLDGFSLAQAEDHFSLTLSEPGTLRRCHFELYPCAPRLSVSAVGDLEKPILGMMYYTYPRLKLAGQVDGIPVSGEAWLDHQWGDYSWVAHRSSGRVLGWDWMGINLDDGSDWVIFVQRDAQNKKAFAKHITVRNCDEEVYVSHSLILKPLREWESRKTAIRHPVEWQIKIPDLKADLIFTPLIDDEEIPIFGLMRAIWQGAGKVSGSVAGKPVLGRARGEFQGYGYVFDFQDYLKTFASRVIRHIESFLPKEIDKQTLRKYVGSPTWRHEPLAYSEMLSKPVWDLVSRPGKRWRPIFALLLLNALGRDPEPFESLVCVLAELCHTGSLIIDDIEDSSKLRRGDECIHLRYGPDVAINAANTLYFLPSLQIFNHPHLTEMQRLEIHELMVQQYLRAHFGQTLDLYWSRNMNVKNLRNWLKGDLEPKILQMYEYKTAAPVEGMAAAAAIIAGVNSQTRSACESFARALGVAFQIMDDVQDFSLKPKKRKRRGEDLISSKLTYVFVRALRNLKEPEAARLQEIICSQELRNDPERIKEAIELVRKSKALAICRDEAKALAGLKWRNLAKILPSSEPKMMLEMLYHSLVEMRLRA